jgi:2-polyprenyl-3-methyl-5-hydroxy-6-metoxy-1,4-benzoquinol methylase
MTFKLYLKESCLAFLSRVTHRRVVMLPQEALSESDIFDLRAPYSVEDPLQIDLRETTPGLITAALIEYNGHFPNIRVWESSSSEYVGPCKFAYNLTDGTVHIAGRKWGTAPLPRSRRFCWSFVLRSDQVERHRITSHYQKVRNRVSDSGYFQGDNYVDHELQSKGEPARVLQLIRQHRAIGPVLEVGCATGAVLERLVKEGIPSYGIDISEWATEKAKERLGQGRVWVCDANTGKFPEALLSHGPFGVLVLWAVLEHFQKPFRVLETLTHLMAPGATLLINTTNADSLSHMIFGTDWEGYFDWTHLGVDQVSVATIRQELPRIGWRISELDTEQAWDGSADPTRATLREWYASDARFRRMLSERDLGDIITCVAVRS